MLAVALDAVVLVALIHIINDDEASPITAIIVAFVRQLGEKTGQNDLFDFRGDFV